jgi:hypothetical protein
LKTLTSKNQNSVWDSLLNLLGFVGFIMGIPWVGIFHTVPVPANTIPVPGIYQYRLVHVMVPHETCGITITHGILILKILKLTITITRNYYYHYNIVFKNDRRTRQLLPLVLVK